MGRLVPGMMREYDLISDWYASHRSTEVGIPDVASLSRTLPPGARILDLGCGNGIPIARFLLESGFEVFGVDSSTEMIAWFRENCPGASAEHATIQDSDFFRTTFDAVVAWGVLFHLTGEDQELAIARVSQVLKPGGRFLFTAGEQEGTVTSPMNGVPFQHVSLGAERYRSVLRQHGFDLLDEHTDPWDNYVILAERRHTVP